MDVPGAIGRYRLAGLADLWNGIRYRLAQALGRSGPDRGIVRTSAAVLAVAILCTGFASYTYLRNSLVRDRTAVLEAELERRSQQFSLAVNAKMQIARALAARTHTARAMRAYQADGTAVTDLVKALMALQLTATNLVEAGELRAVELRSLDGDRVASAGSLPELPRLTMPLSSGSDLIYWDRGVVLRILVDVVGEDGVAGAMLADLRVSEADKALMGIERLGSTGEAGLCGRSGPARICFPSRFQPEGSVGTVRLPAVLPSDRALAGERGTLQVVDYRNQATFSAFQPLESFGLAFIVKVNESELLAPVRRQVLLGVLALVVLAAVGAVLMGRQLKPLTAELVSARQRADAEVASRIAAEAEIRLAKRQLQLVADNAQLLIAFLDPKFVYRFANRAHEEWFQRSVDQIIGKPMEALVGEVLFAEYRQAMDASLATQAPQIVFRERLHDGNLQFIEVTFVAQTDENGELEGYCVTARDATANVLRENTLFVAARRDPLTGLCNRTSFNERLEQALLQVDEDGRLLAVAYLDIDYFKQVNDSFGHGVGDQLLKEIGERIKGTLPASDTTARLGGDELGLIMRLAAPADAMHVGSRLLEVLRQPFTIDGHCIQTSVSIGFAFAAPDDTIMMLIRRADMALYEAKRGGRNGVFLAGIPTPHVGEVLASLSTR